MLVLVLAAFMPAFASETPLRQEQPCNTDWRFRRQASPGAAIEPEFVGAEKSDYDDTSWKPIALPHTWDATADNPFTVPHHFRGVGWYRRSFRVRANWTGRRVAIRFKGVFQIADVWINGHHLGTHVGGFTGFEFDMTDYLNWNGANVLAVRVNDVLDPNIAPANETNVPGYGGIYRTASIEVTDPVHVAPNGTWLSTEKSGAGSIVHVRTWVINSDKSPRDVRVKNVIEDENGQTVASFESAGSIMPAETKQFDGRSQAIANEHLWSPDSPYLYQLATTVLIEGRTTDTLTVPFGIRYMDHDSEHGFLLNGKPINLHGVDRRQDYGFLGDAVPEAIGVRDIEWIKHMGANFIRTAHYPQDPAVIEACDRLGILVWEEVPNIKIYVYPPSADRTEPAYTERFPRGLMANIKQQLREMIERDRNHPSIIMWGFADDLSLYHYPEDFVELSNFTHSLDVSRWTAGRAPHVTDIIDATSSENLLKEHLDHPERKYVWNEWGAFEAERGREGKPFFDRPHPDPGSDVSFSDSDAALLIEGYWTQWMALPWLGTAKWCMFDTGELNAVGSMSLWTRDGEGKVNFRWPFDDYLGVSDMWRLPKNGFYFLQSQWTEKPMVHIVGHWNWPDPNAKRTVRVYSNADTVELFLNNRPLGVQHPATMDRVWRDFHRVIDRYDAKDEFNQERLPGSTLKHPPFIWDDVPSEPGTLVAVAHKGNDRVRDEVRTAGPAARIVLKPEKKMLASDGADVSFIEADVVDSAGTVVPDARPWIKFTAEGPGRLLGATEIDAISGIAAINVQNTGQPGEVVVRATSPGLQAGSAQISTGETQRSSPRVQGAHAAADK
jgi:beta-galactosidase